jgi:hypothetical protein
MSFKDFDHKKGLGVFTPRPALKPVAAYWPLTMVHQSPMIPRTLFAE